MGAVRAACPASLRARRSILLWSLFCGPLRPGDRAVQEDVPPPASPPETQLPSGHGNPAAPVSVSIPMAESGFRAKSDLLRNARVICPSRDRGSDVTHPAPGEPDGLPGTQSLLCTHPPSPAGDSLLCFTDPFALPSTPDATP